MQAFVVMVLAAVLIAMGGFTPLGHLVYDFGPGAKEFRDWGRTLWLANLGVAMLAGLGVRELLHAPRRARFGIAMSPLAVALVVVALPHFRSLHSVLATGSDGTIARWSPVVLLALLAAAVAATVVHRRAGTVAIIAVCALDMVSFAYVAPWHGQSLTPAAAHTFYNASPPVFGVPEKTAGGLDRWATDSYIFRSISLAKNLLGVNGYDPLLQKDWLDLRRAASQHTRVEQLRGSHRLLVATRGCGTRDRVHSVGARASIARGVPRRRREPRAARRRPVAAR